MSKLSDAFAAQQTGKSNLFYFFGSVGNNPPELKSVHPCGVEALSEHWEINTSPNRLCKSLLPWLRKIQM